MRKLGSTLAAAGAALALAAPAGAQDGVVVADHLNNPRQFDVTPAGAVYVAEAGRGGSHCTTSTDPDTGEPTQACWGYTSSVTRITPGKAHRVMGGMLSVSDPVTAFSGLSSVAFSPFGGFVGTEQSIGGLPSFSRAGDLQEGALMSFAPFTRARVLTQIDDFEVANDPDKQGIESDPYGVDATDDAYYVADAAGNDLLRLSRFGQVSLVTVFDQINGQDPVPTSVRVGPDGAIYVGLLALQAGPGAAKVVRVASDGSQTDYATGLTSVVGIDFDSHGNLYVAEIFGGDDGSGQLVKVTPTGEKSTIGAGQVFLPGGVGIGNDDSIYVSNFSILPGHPPAIPDAPPGARGQVLRFRAGS